MDTTVVALLPLCMKVVLVVLGAESKLMEPFSLAFDFSPVLLNVLESEDG